MSDEAYLSVVFFFFRYIEFRNMSGGKLTYILNLAMQYVRK